MTNFEQAFDRLIGHEGGYSSDPKDPGNWTGGRVGVGENKGTKFGIASNTYPDLDIKNLTLEQAKSIYKRDWWDRIGADTLHPALVFQMWDFAVNAGMDAPKRALQYAVGVAQDGHIGPLTLTAVNRSDVADILMRFNAFRLRYYVSLSTWALYGKGWINRVASDLDYAAQDI